DGAAGHTIPRKNREAEPIPFQRGLWRGISANYLEGVSLPVDRRVHGESKNGGVKSDTEFGAGGVVDFWWHTLYRHSIEDAIMDWLVWDEPGAGTSLLTSVGALWRHRHLHTV